MQGTRDTNKGLTRRSFLGKISLGLAALIGVGVAAKGASGGPSAPAAADAQFPGEDSIYHPRKDPRIESAERRWSS